MLADAIDEDDAKRWSRDDRVEVLGLLLTYKSIYWLQKREELKIRGELDEVRQVTHTKEWSDQKTTFESIVNRHGRQLLDLLKTTDVRELTAAARQNTVTGLLQLVEVCIRLRKLELAEEICQWVITNVANNSRYAFESKLSRIRNYRRTDLKRATEGWGTKAARSGR